jgi:tetratricopeptide (TPR) repeat protein
MANSIFISLTEWDTPLAKALQTALRAMLGEAVEVRFSTSKEIGVGPATGEDWFNWIVQQVRECDFAFILVTPASLNKPWILWEAGAVQGAAIAAGIDGLRKVRPIVYQLEMEQVPSPIRDSKVHCRYGDREDDVKLLFDELLQAYDKVIGYSRMSRAIESKPQTIRDYLASVRESLLRAPTTPTSVALEEWLLRLNALVSENRLSEAAALEDWMEIAFGRGPGEQPRPLDIRLHTRLADVHLRNRDYQLAVKQLELARRVAPRDMYILRSLGGAYLKCGQHDQAKAVIDQMKELEPAVFERNVECAALAARWHRDSRQPREASNVLRQALEKNEGSYYLANLLGEVLLESSDVDAAGQAFRRALEILSRVRDINVWTYATAANANFVLGEDERALECVRAIAAGRPDAGPLATVERGLRKLAPHLANGEARVLTLIAALQPREEPGVAISAGARA